MGGAKDSSFAFRSLVQTLPADRAGEMKFPGKKNPYEKKKSAREKAGRGEK